MVANESSSRRRRRRKRRENPRALKHHEFLTLLGRSKQAKRRKTLLEAASSDEIRSIAECALNVLKNRIKLNNQQKRKLKRHKDVLRYISQRNKNTKKKRRLLQMKGGFLTTLIPLALSALTSFVPALFGKQ